MEIDLRRNGVAGTQPSSMKAAPRVSWQMWPIFALRELPQIITHRQHLRHPALV